MSFLLQLQRLPLHLVYKGSNQYTIPWGSIVAIHWDFNPDSGVISNMPAGNFKSRVD